MTTTISSPGRITSVSFNTNSLSIVSLNGGTGGSPQAIIPADADVLVVLASIAPDSVFQMSPSFNVGDVVEIYLQTSGGITVLDENGNDIADNRTVGEGAICRKIATGAGRTWGVTSAD